MKRRKAWTLSVSAIVACSLLLSACSGQDAAAPTGGGDAKGTEAVGTPGAGQNGVTGIKDGLIPASDKSKIPEAAKKRTDTFVVSLTEPGGIFNPYFYQNGYDGNVNSVLFAQLVDIDKNGKPIPGMAEKWELSDDQLTYTFKLRAGLKFSDGSPLTADDVAFTLTLLHDPAYDGQTDIAQAAVKGGKDYKEGKAATVEGIQVVDPQTIKITTDKVNAQALYLLGGQVLSKAYYGKDYKPGKLDSIKQLHSKPLESGPYKLEKFIPGQEVRFVANPNFYKGKPAVEHFIYKTTEGDATQFFQTGETDYSGFTGNQDNMELLQTLGFANIDVYTASSYSYIKFNHSKPFFKDKRVRQAFIYGLDRQKIVDTIYQGYGQVANVPVSPISWAYTEEGVNPYPFDQEKAKKLLDEAGWKPGKDGIREKDGQRLTVRFFGSKGKVTDILIPIAKENYKAVGIDFQTELMDYNALLAKSKKGEHDLVSFSTAILIDPDDGVQSFNSKYKGSFTDTNGYSNPKVDELVAKAVGTLDIEKRKQAYKELYKELSDDPPYILLNYRKILGASNSRIKGLELNGFNSVNASLPTVQIEP
ncbi:ABC transporter substrate-binding protein [Paenibacillus oleatilyticus]|uniref:ABC transporter substrate-binding protein n=1 Tax=Paenibacillus oleatilyticus TaxID=2594886 RepID=A0ABV4V3D1_9BACL